MEFPQKTRIELPYDPEVPLLGICLKKRKTGFNNTSHRALRLTEWPRSKSIGKAWDISDEDSQMPVPETFGSP